MVGRKMSGNCSRCGIHMEKTAPQSGHLLGIALKKLINQELLFNDGIILY